MTECSLKLWLPESKVLPDSCTSNCSQELWLVEGGRAPVSRTTKCSYELSASGQRTAFLPHGRVFAGAVALREGAAGDQGVQLHLLRRNTPLLRACAMMFTDRALLDQERLFVVEWKEMEGL